MLRNLSETKKGLGPYLLGVDLGTLGSKGAIVDVDGNVVAQAFVEHAILHPRLDWAEQNPEEHYWGDFVKIVQLLLSKSVVDATSIAGISVSGTYPTLCVIDQNGDPVRPAILYLDNRAKDENKYLDQLLGPRPTLVTDMTPRILWLKKNEPSHLAKTRMLLEPSNYVVYKLTGNYTMDYNYASDFRELFDLKRLEWNTDACERFGIPIEIFPPVHAGSDIAGEVTPKAAERTGLAPKTPVIVGTGDALLSMLGAGVTETQDGSIYYGTAGALDVLPHELMSILTGPGRPKALDTEKRDVPVLATLVPSTGGLLRWFRDQFGHYELDFEKRLGLDAYRILDQEASQIPPGSGGVIVLPYLLGQRTPVRNPQKRGVIFGLTASHTRAHIYHSLLESFGYALREGLVQLERENLLPRRIVAMGGGAQSEMWRQIISDVIGMPQEYPHLRTSSEAYGGAYLAGYAVRIFADLRSLKEKWLGTSSITNPNVELRNTYDALFRLYGNLDSILTNMWE